MPDFWMDVDTALAEVPVNLMPLIDDTTFKDIEDAVAYNAAGLSLIWHFVTTAGVYNNGVAVTPTNTGGDYDWVDHGSHGIYTIEIPASGGASINNDTEGFGWFTGKATGVLPWRGPTIGFRAAALNNALIDGGDELDVNVTQLNGSSPAAILLALSAGTMLAGTVDNTVHTPTTTEFECDDVTESNADQYKGRVAIFTSGVLLKQAGVVSAYSLVSGRGHFTITPALTDAPGNNDTLIIV